MAEKEIKPTKPEYLKTFIPPTYEFDELPWVNIRQLQADISVNGNSAITDAQQAELDDHEARIEALENAWP